MASPNGTAAKYVYGVVRARGGQRAEAKGINGEPVELVALEQVGALTSDVPPDFGEAGREELLAHSRVLEQALEAGVVLPMRFGVVMPDEGSVREQLLGAHREELEAQLDEMDGKVEINVKAIYDESVVLRQLIEANPEIAQLRQSLQGQPEDATYYERIRLGELVAAALNETRERDEREMVDRLAPFALAVEVGPAVHERMALNASFLVEGGALGSFDRALEELGEQQAGRIRFKYTGPLPPHSFVELGLEA
jgi:hypothetical protein